MAGLLLKNGLAYTTDLSSLIYVKGVILQGLSDKDQMIRQTVAQVITALIGSEEAGKWPEALNAVTQGMGSQDINLAEVS